MERTRDEIEAIINANKPLAYNIAKKWGRGLTEDEYRSAGLRGLWRAAKIWDPAKGKLGTILEHYVRAECQSEGVGRNVVLKQKSAGVQEVGWGTTDESALVARADENSPQPFDEALEREADAEIKSRVAALLRMLNERQATVIKMRFGIGHPQSYKLHEIGDRLGIRKQMVAVIESQAMRIMAGKAPPAQGRIEDPIPGIGFDPMDELKNHLGVLNQRARRIMEMRFGLNGEPKHKLEKIAARMGISVGYVNQIQRAALIAIRDAADGNPIPENAATAAYADQESSSPKASTESAVSATQKKTSPPPHDQTLVEQLRQMKDSIVRRKIELDRVIESIDIVIGLAERRAS